MFNLPFPTDSLYKFAFMFGLVLIVYSFYYSDSHLDKYDKKQTYQKLDSLRARNIIIDSSKSDNLYNYKYYETFKEKEFFTVADSKIWFKNFRTEWHYDTTNVVIKSKFSQILNFPESENQPLIKELRTFVLTPNTSNSEFKDQLLKLLSAYTKKKPEVKQFFDAIANEPDPAKIKSTLKNFFGRFYEKSDREYFNESNALFTIISDWNTKDKEATNDKITQFADRYNEFTRYFYALLFLGIILFLIGTAGWYYKLQRPQDMLLKKQLAEVDKKAVESEGREFKARKHFEPKILPRPEVRNKI
jgi:hypothetical protein